MSPLQLGLLALIFVLVSAAVWAAAALLRPDPTRQRLAELTGGDAVRRPRGAWLDGLARLTAPLGKLATPEESDQQSAVRLRFWHAGIRNASAPAAFFGVKTALTLLLPVLTLAAITAFSVPLKGNTLLMAVLFAAAFGYYLPNWVLGRMVATRQREIFENFPDALDMMTVGVEAGLGTEAAMIRVAEDMAHKSPALADELKLVNLELRAGADRERALRNLATRTGVDEVDSFVTMISQAERFGTSIAASLRVHSDMLRTRRKQRAEEAAAKIALKLLFPLIFCIFPSLMVVLMGPAMIQVYRVLLPTMGGSSGG